MLIGGGPVAILDAASRQRVAEAKVEGDVADVSWWHDGAGISIASARGEVWEYDVGARGFSGRWRDEGGLHHNHWPSEVGSLSSIVDREKQETKIKLM